MWKTNLASGYGKPGNDTGRARSLTAAGASVSVHMRQMLKFRASQNGIHHPPEGMWWKILFHHHDNSCHTIAIVTGWTLLVFNHTLNGQRANEDEPPGHTALLCSCSHPNLSFCSVIQTPSMFPEPHPASQAPHHCQLSKPKSVSSSEH